MTATARVLLAIVSGTTTTAIQARRAMMATERERIVQHFVSDVFKADGRARNGAAKSPLVARPERSGSEETLGRRVDAGDAGEGLARAGLSDMRHGRGAHCGRVGFRSQTEGAPGGT